MKTQQEKKLTIKVASQEQHDNLRNQRRTLKVLQEAANDKENLVSRVLHDKDTNIKKDSEKNDTKQKKQLQHKGVQTGEAIITEDDLTSEEPSADYWRILAEKRGDALNNSLQENEHLKEQIDNLQEENKICKEMLDESRTLVEVLQEMIGENDTSTEIAEEAVETS